MIQSITYTITTNKNLKCYGCSDNCEKFLAEKYVEPENFLNHMRILQNICSPSEIHFSGGECLLHKKLEEICQIAHTIFPNADICIHTNGILMNTLKDEQLLNLTQKNNVKFLFHLYPIIGYLKNYQKQIDRFSRLNIDMFWTHEHIYFNKFTINRYGNCYNALKYKHQLLIVDGKLYPLCSMVQNIQYYLTSNNYIDLNNLTDISQIEQLFNSIDCSICRGNSNPLSNIYINNYKNYETLLDYVYDLGAFLKIPFFYKNIQDSTSPREFEAILNRHLDGWMDIYIPFYKSIEKNEILKLKQLLKKQENINKFNLYFVGIDEDIATQKQWFEIFELSDDNELNTYFLKDKSLYLGEKKFFNYSRIINHYILDINNLEALEDSSYLSKMAKIKGD